ncbi:MAG TPA: peptidylprolyl isomerase [Gemmatimonadaceae bacterium]
MSKVSIAAFAALVPVMACEGLKEAMTAHVDVVARAESQELTVERLADLMGKSPIPVSRPVAEQVADIWVSYQLLGRAGADGDSLVDIELIDKVMWPVYTQSKTQKWLQMVQQTFTVDTSTASMEAAFNEGRLLSARHILFQIPAGQAATASDSVQRKAESVLRQTNDGNFAAMAKQYGSDGTKDQGGDLGVFPPQGAMVEEFSRAVQALTPGEIGPLVKTQFGYHIVRRNTFAEVRDQFRMQYEPMLMQTAQSTYFAGVEQRSEVDVKPNAPKVVKEVAADLAGHKGNRTVVATSVLGNFTAGDVARWVGGVSQREQLRGNLQAAPDSMLPNFVKSLLLQELFLKQADSAGITLDSNEVNSVRSAFKGLVRNSWAGLRVAPEMLADSAKDRSEKRQLAATRVDAYLSRLLAQQEGFVEIPPPLAEALRERYDGNVREAGIVRVVELAGRIRASADSARAAAQPPSAVPLPKDTGKDGSR